MEGRTEGRNECPVPPLPISRIIIRAKKGGGGVKNNKNMQRVSSIRNVCTNGVRLYIETWSQFVNKQKKNISYTRQSTLHFFNTIKFFPRSFEANQCFSRKCLPTDEDEFYCALQHVDVSAGA